MPFVYNVSTYNKLPKSKETFACYCKAQQYIKNILNTTPKKLANEDLEGSIRVIRIDADAVPSYEGLFLRNAIK